MSDRINQYPSTGLYPGPITFPDSVYPDNPIGLELYSSLAPLVDTWGDPEEDLKLYCNAIAAMIQPVDDIAKDGENGEPGWSQVLDAQRAKDDWLFWLGQFVGYVVPQKAATISQSDWSLRERQRLVTRSTYRRGTIAILREVIQEHLNPPQTVIIQERVGTAHVISVWVYASQIATSAALVQTAALAEKAAGLVMNFTVLSGTTYTLLAASNTSYTVLAGKHTSYTSVATNPGL